VDGGGREYAAPTAENVLSVGLADRGGACYPAVIVERAPDGSVVRTVRHPR
jgi:hypothetical protein